MDRRRSGLSSVASLFISPAHLTYVESATAPGERSKEPLLCYGIEGGWKELNAYRGSSRLAQQVE